MSKRVNTDELIDGLAADLMPVRRVPPLKTWILQSVLAASFSISCALILLGVRTDFFAHVILLKYAVPAAMFVALALFSVISARFFSVPGNDDAFTLPAAVSLGLIVWLGIIAYQILTAPSNTLTLDGLGCTCNMIAFSLPVYFVLARLVYRAAPIRLRMAGLSISAAGASVGALCSYLICSSDSALHVFVWHFLPFFAVGCSGIFLATCFDWQQRISRTTHSR